MDSVKLDHDNKCSEDTSSNQLLSPDSPVTSDIFGDPQVIPRVGHEYQAEVPSLTTEMFHLQDPTDTEMMSDVKNSIQSVDRSGSGGSESAKESQMDSKSCLVKEYATGCEMDVDLPLLRHMKSNLESKCKTKDYIPVLGSPESSWSDIEQESFLLGLYIFGKNLLQVKRFVESKDMGNVLHFYYGKFYRSDGYLRWSKCRNKRSRRFICGQRIFTGWRQQELLSRLLPCTPEDCRNTLLEATKTFSEGKLSLEKYVSTLKATVGLKVLVEAVGIGKGKNDLTSNDIEPIKTNQVTAACSEIPTGKACSYLTSGEIIKFLTGNFRLSKARSNDLFWEAVWPRLLARGWHSEQPKNHSYVAAKHSLVFIIPGIKKFSRRKLVKGDHYFDSISDVLNKVALDPKLIELEVEVVSSSRCKKEYEKDPDTISNQIGLSDHQHHCYLLPRVPTCNLELMKFTVVDTSLVNRKEMLKVRELRTLPLDDNHISSKVILSRETNGDTFGSQVEKSDSVDATMNHDSRKGNSMAFVPDLPDRVITLSKKRILMDGMDSANRPTDIQYSDMLNDENQEKSLKCLFTRRTTSTRPKLLVPVMKKRRLNACTVSSHCTDVLSTGCRLKEEKPRVLSCSLEARNIMSEEVVPSELKISSSSSGKECTNERSKCIRGSETSTVGNTLSHESPRLPHIPSDFETSEPFTTGAADSRVDSNAKGASFKLDSNQQHEDSRSLGTSDGVNTAQLPTENSRRHGTRNRPLTKKVLEAFESGFFNKRRRRGPKALLH